MTFSSGVKLGDLDDFISAAQECVKPLIQAAEGRAATLEADDARSVGRALRAEAQAPQVQKPSLIRSKQSGSDPKAQIGQVTLSDCLACSGCVTSAETVLLQEQSGEEFLKRVATSPLTVVSVFGEARSSLAAHCGASPLLTLQRLATVLRRLGVTYVLEGSAAEAVALLEGSAEFVRRFKNQQSPTAQAAPLPLLTSHCPGWTCYAEKVVDPSVLPHLSPLRPPQQLQGRLVKTCLLEAHNRRRLHRWWRARSPLFAGESWWWLRALLAREASGASGASGRGAWGREPLVPSDVYHVAVQPCFDRKIEAARPHFQAPGEAGVREVDTVLTATEILDLVRTSPEAPEGAEGAEVLAAEIPCPLDAEVITDLLLGDIRAGRAQPLLCCVRDNAGSGGFIEHVFRQAASELFQMELGSLEFRTRQNEDMREVVLEDPRTRRVLLRFVSAHGFRNVQNVIRRLGRGKGADDAWHFVEIMACPGGCLNGAGTILPPKTDGARVQDRRERLDALEALLHHADGTTVVPPAEHPLVLPLYRYIVAKAASTGGGDLEQPLAQLVGTAPVRSWLSADWRSLKVDSEGKAVIGTSSLKW